MKVLKVAIIGWGGFAKSHHKAINILQSQGKVELIATCDPQWNNPSFAPMVEDFKSRGVQIYPDYLHMLDACAGDLDYVTIPTPIPLHAPMHRACVEHGLAVYLEKPPTLDWRELEAMIEVEKDSQFRSQVGFNFIVEQTRQNLKSRILEGYFGALQRVTYVGFHPRSKEYYERASWAGKLRSNGHLILDSCMGNALAHQIHNLLFWCGEDEILSWGNVSEVEAELYRAHSIENFDTVFARGTCGKVQFRIGATHTGHSMPWQHEILECEKARIVYKGGKGHEIFWRNAEAEKCVSLEESVDDLLVRNLRHFGDYLNGLESRPLTTLPDCRPFVTFNDLLIIAGNHIHTIPDSAITPKTGARNETLYIVEELEEYLQNYVEDGQFPSENGVRWSAPGGRTDSSQLNQLDSVVNNICATDNPKLI